MNEKIYPEFSYDRHKLKWWEEIILFFIPEQRTEDRNPNTGYTTAMYYKMFKGRMHIIRVYGHQEVSFTIQDMSDKYYYDCEEIK